MPETLRPSAKITKSGDKEVPTLVIDKQSTLRNMTQKLAVDVGYGKADVISLLDNFEKGFTSLGIDAREAWAKADIELSMVEEDRRSAVFHPDYQRLRDAGFSLSGRRFRAHRRA